MRTAILTAVNAEGKTEILYGEAPYTDVKELADKLLREPPKGYTEGTIWASDRPAKWVKWNAKAVTTPAPVKAKTK